MSVGKEVSHILTSISSATGLGTCLYDTHSFFNLNYGKLDKFYTGHYCDFCKSVRELNGGRDACIKNDVQYVKELAQTYKKPFFHVCHIGICEYIIPIFKKDNFVGIVFIGQCRIEGETKFENIEKNLLKFDANTEHFKPLFDKLPVTSRETLSAVGSLADYAFKLLADRSNFLIDNTKTRDLVAAAKDYINNNYTAKITLSDISQYLYVNSSYLSRVFKERTGQSITEYINQFKMEKAENLLQFTTIPIAHIAYHLGFSDPNYFTRIFKQVTGLSPSEYRTAAK